MKCIYPFSDLINKIISKTIVGLLVVLCVGFAAFVEARDLDDSILKDVYSVYEDFGHAFHYYALFGYYGLHVQGAPPHGHEMKSWNPDGTEKGTIVIDSYEDIYKKNTDDALTMGADVLLSHYFGAGTVVDTLNKSPYEVTESWKKARDYYGDGNYPEFFVWGFNYGSLLAPDPDYGGLESLQKGLKYAQDKGVFVGLCYWHDGYYHDYSLRQDEYEIINTVWGETVYSGNPLETWVFNEDWADLETTCNYNSCDSPYSCAQENNCTIAGSNLNPVMVWGDIPDDNQTNYRYFFDNSTDKRTKKGVHENYLSTNLVTGYVRKGPVNYSSAATYALQEYMMEYFLSSRDDSYAFTDNGTTGGLGVDGLYVDVFFRDNRGHDYATSNGLNYNNFMKGLVSGHNPETIVAGYSFDGTSFTYADNLNGMIRSLKMIVDKLRGRTSSISGDLGEFKYGIDGLDNQTTTGDQKLLLIEDWYDLELFLDPPDYADYDNDTMDEYKNLIDGSRGPYTSGARKPGKFQPLVQAGWYYQYLSADFLNLDNPNFEIATGYDADLKHEMNRGSESELNDGVTRRPYLKLQVYQTKDMNSFGMHTSDVEVVGGMHGYLHKFPDNAGKDMYDVEDIKDWLEEDTWDLSDNKTRRALASKKTIAMHLVRASAKANNLNYILETTENGWLSQAAFDRIYTTRLVNDDSRWTAGASSYPDDNWVNSDLPFGYLYFEKMWLGYPRQDKGFASTNQAFCMLADDEDCVDIDFGYVGVKEKNFGGDFYLEDPDTLEYFDSASTAYLNFLDNYEDQLLKSSLILSKADFTVHAIYVDVGNGTDNNIGLSWDQAKGTIEAAIDMAAVIVNYEKPFRDAVVPIYVAKGTYTENIELVSGIVLLGGYDAATGERNILSNETIIDGDGSGPVVTGADDSKIDGFTIQNGSSCFGGGIKCDGTSPIISNNIIKNNYANDGSCTWSTEGYGAGIYINDASPIIKGNTIDNNAANWSGGISIHGDSSPLIDSNMIKLNEATVGGGIGHSGGSSSIVTNNIIVENTVDCFWGLGGGGILAGDNSSKIINNTIVSNVAECGNGGGIALSGSFPTIENNIIWDNGDDISPDTCSEKVNHNNIQDGGCSGYDNIRTNPKFVDSTNGDYHLQPNSPCIDNGTSTNAPDNDVDGNDRPTGAAIDIGADEVHYIYVDDTGGNDDKNGQSWDNATETIGAALKIAEANSPATILVDAGTYEENIELVSKVVLLGGYDSSTGKRNILSNETIIDGDGSGPVVTGADDSKIDGFTIQNGSSCFGGGIKCDGTSPIISNNIIKNNYANDGSCTWSTEGYGAGIYINDASPIIKGNTIDNNAANWSGGISIHGDSSPLIDSNIITSNEATMGGGISDILDTSSIITNNIIAENTASCFYNLCGGGILAASSGSKIINNTIVGNSSDGISIITSVFPAINNNILWNNGDDLYTSIQGGLDCDQITFNDIEDGDCPNDTNISTNPLFVDLTNGDYHLQPNSPCIDNGTSTGAPSYDIDGDERPEGSGYDIGADEYVSP